MKKITAVILLLLACTVFFTGCASASASTQEPSVRVYSFSGENEQLSLSNGVLVLGAEEEICYGGDLKAAPEAFAGITAYTASIYIDGKERQILLSNSAEDASGGTVDPAGQVGKISGDVLRDGAVDQLAEDLWFELKTTNLQGEENTCQIQLKVVEITE